MKRRKDFDNENGLSDEILPKSKDINLKNYDEDVEGISLKKITAGLWFVTNKKHFRTGLIVFLSVASSIMIIYALYNYLHYYLIGLKNDEELARGIVETTTISKEYLDSQLPVDLVQYPVTVIKSEVDSYDLVGKIKNPNNKHWGRFNFCFVLGSQDISCQEGFILPNETKYIFALAQDLGGYASNVQLVLRNFSWVKINAHKFPNWEQYYSEHLNFTFENIDFKPASQSGLSEKENLNSLEFAALNNTAYSYWQAPLSILFFNGSTLTGVHKYIMSEFYSGEKRNLKMVWPGNMGKVSKIEIVPDINITDDNVFFKYKKEIETGEGIEE